MHISVVDALFYHSVECAQDLEEIKGSELLSLSDYPWGLRGREGKRAEFLSALDFMPDPAYLLMKLMT